MDIIVIVLGANTKSIRTHDSKNLITYALKTFKYIDVSTEIDKAFNLYKQYFKNNFNLVKTSTIPILKLEKLPTYKFPILSNNSSIQLKTKFYIQNSFSAHTPKNSIVGKLELYDNSKLLCSLNVILDNQLIHNNWKFYFNKIVSYKYF